MEELLASLTQKQLNLIRGQEVEGKVISKTGKEILVDFGSKSEGFIQNRDIPSVTLEQIKVGDTIKAYVIDPENEAGQTVLTMRRSDQGGSGSRWSKFQEAKDSGNSLNGVVTEPSGEGLIVEVEGIKGFLPASQMTDSSKKAELIGKKIQIGVLEVDQVANKLIFSQKVGGQSWVKLAEKYPEEKIVKGRVTKVTQFGLFILLEEGLEGLLHSSKLGPDDNFAVGQELSVMVDSIDVDRKRISLVPVITSTKGLIYK